MSTLLTPVDLTKLSLAAALNATPLINKIDWQYTDRFEKNQDNPIGASTNIRRPVRGTVTMNNMAYTSGAGNIVENFSTLIINTTATAFMSKSECDIALRLTPAQFMSRFAPRIGEQIGETIDSRIYDALVNGATNWSSTAFTGSGQPVLGSSAVQTPVQPGAMWVISGTGNSGSDASPGTLTSADLRKAVRRLDDMAAPKYGRYGVLTPAASEQAATAQITLFNAQEAISDIYTNGYIGTFAGVTWAMSQSPASHTNGAWAGSWVSDTSAISGSTWAETGSITISGGTNTTTMNAGDVFTIAGVFAVNPKTYQNTGTLQQFTVMTAVASATTAGQALVVSPCPITTGPERNIAIVGAAAGKVVTLIGTGGATYQESILFVKEAIGGAAPSLFVPKGHHFAAYKSDENTGLGIRTIQTFDSLGAATGLNGVPTLITRFDAIIGVKVLRPEWCVRIRTSA